MTTKEQVLELLSSRQGQYISGQEIGDTLHLTRSAIWKAIKGLREQGHIIEAVTNLGYRLPASSDELSASRIQKMFPDNGVIYPTIHLADTIPSTNEWAKGFYDFDPDAEHLFIANEQTSGHGRRGRSFHSAPDTGIYMSLLLNAKIEGSHTTLITGMTAVAVCEAVKKVTGIPLEIKWVNDLYYKDRKVAGILTEGVYSLEEQCIDHVIIGIGINLFPPKDGFPKELQGIAGSIFSAGNAPFNIRNTLIAEIVKSFYRYYPHLESREYLDEYRSRSNLIGKWVKINASPGYAMRSSYAEVLGIDDDMHLLVRFENGSEKSLFTGEVSVVKY